MSTKETTTTKPKQNAVRQSMSPEQNANLGVALQVLDGDLKPDSSPLMNTLDNSITRLNNLMHSQFEKVEQDYLEDKEATQLKYEQVNNICMVAKEVREMMKVKVDVLKIKRDVIKEVLKK